MTDRRAAGGDYQQLLFEAMLQGVIFQDAEGKVLSMNPAAVRILGKTPDEFIGQMSESVAHDTVREDGSLFLGAEHPSMVALRTGLEQRDVVMGVFNPREKRHRWISISAVPLFRPGEAKPYEVFTLFDDISASRRMAQVLRESGAQLKTIVENIADGLVLTPR